MEKVWWEAVDRQDQRSPSHHGHSWYIIYIIYINRKNGLLHISIKDGSFGVTFQRPHPDLHIIEFFLLWNYGWPLLQFSTWKAYFLIESNPGNLKSIHSYIYKMSPSRYPCAVTFIWRDLLITVSDTQFFLSPNIEVILRSMEYKLWKGLSFKFDTIISIHTKNLIVTVDGDFLNLQGLKFWEWEDSFEGIFCHGSSSFCLYFLQ